MSLAQALYFIVQTVLSMPSYPVTSRYHTSADPISLNSFFARAIFALSTPRRSYELSDPLISAVKNTCRTLPCLKAIALDRHSAKIHTVLKASERYCFNARYNDFGDIRPVLKLLFLWFLKLIDKLDHRSTSISSAIHRLKPTRTP